MRMLFALAAALMALLAPLPADEAAARRDWTATVTRTPAGAFVVGNPKAKVKLVEYLSLTCGHCAHFTGEAWGPLKAAYVGKGLVSLEVRHALRDAFDVTASLLSVCEGPEGYFDAIETVLAKQDEWSARAGSFQEEGLEAKPMNERMMALARGSGLDLLFAGRGMARARIAACLSNPAEQRMLTAMAQEAWSKRKIGGTPAFLINGVLQPEVSSWEALEPKLKAALK